MNRGDAAAGTWRFLRRESRRRGYAAETSRPRLETWTRPRCLRYAKLKEELDEVTKSQDETGDRVNTLSGDLSQVADQLDEMKGTMADRGNSMTDTSPLVSIKQALKQIKKEVVAFDLQIGVVGHTLMQQKLKHGAPDASSKGYKLRGETSADADAGFDDDSDLDSL